MFAPQQNDSPPHVVRPCRTKSQTLDSGCGSASAGLYLASLDVLEVLGSLSFCDALGQDRNQKIVSTPSVRGHATVTTTSQRRSARGCYETGAHRFTNLCTQARATISNLSSLNTMKVFGVMKVCQCVRAATNGGRMMSRALTHCATYFCGFGMGATQQMRATSDGARRYGENGRCHKTEAKW